MKRLFMFLAVAGLATSCSLFSGGEPERYGWNEATPLYGDVASVKIINYVLKDNFGAVVKDGVNWSKEYKFNEAGDVIERLEFGYSGYLRDKYTFGYDENGNLLDESSFDSEGQLDTKFAYKNDENGNPIERTICYADGTIGGRETYKYDEAGNMIEKAEYDAFKEKQRKEEEFWKAGGEK